MFIVQRLGNKERPLDTDERAITRERREETLTKDERD